MLDAMRTEAGDSEPVQTHTCLAEVCDVAEELNMSRTPLNLLALLWAVARGEFGIVAVSL